MPAEIVAQSGPGVAEIKMNRHLLECAVAADPKFTYTLRPGATQDDLDMVETAACVVITCALAAGAANAK